jgi:hypothetical protein
LSASCRHPGPLSSHPTVASFSVTATTSTGRTSPTLHAKEDHILTAKSAANRITSFDQDAPQRPGPLQPDISFRENIRNVTSRRHSTVKVYAATRYASESSQRENVPPPHSSESSRTTPVARPLSKLPKSRTMNILSNITTSISRQSLRPRDFSSSSAANTSSLALPREPTSEPNHLQVHKAQPSAYWTGRFMALHDKFQAEQLQESSLAFLVAAHATRSLIVPPPRRPHHLPPSTTTAAVMTVTAMTREAELLTDDDNRCHRIFTHLEAMCTTPDARRSLHAFQQAYARRMDKSSLLPRGGSMQDSKEGFVYRLFNGRKSLGGIPAKNLGGVLAGKRASIV